MTEEELDEFQSWAEDSTEHELITIAAGDVLSLVAAARQGIAPPAQSVPETPMEYIQRMGQEWDEAPPTLTHGSEGDYALDMQANAGGPDSLKERKCTCHPDDNPPVPCPQKFAYSECLEAAQADSLKERLNKRQSCHCEHGDMAGCPACDTKREALARIEALEKELSMETASRISRGNEIIRLEAENRRLVENGRYHSGLMEAQYNEDKATIATLEAENKRVRELILQYEAVPVEDMEEQIATLQDKLDRLRHVAEMVDQWDWSDNDPEPVADMERLRATLTEIKP